MSCLLYPHFFCGRFSKITRAKGGICKYIVVIIQRPRRVLPPSVRAKQRTSKDKAQETCLPVALK